MASYEVTSCKDGSLFCHSQLLFLDDFNPKLMAIGVFFFFAFAWSVALLVSLLFAVLPRYRDLPNQSRWLLANWAVRGIFSSPVAGFGIYHIFSNEFAGENNIVSGQIPMSGMLAVISCGFHYFDLSMVLLVPTDHVLLLHHIGSALASSYSCVYGKPGGFLVRFMVVNITVPVVFIRLLLDYGGMKYSKVWRMWMYIVIHTYHVRSLIEIYMWVLIAFNWQTIREQLPVLYVIAIFFLLAYVTFYYTPYLVQKYTSILYGSRNPDFNSIVAANGANQSTPSTSNGYVKHDVVKED